MKPTNLNGLLLSWREREEVNWLCWMKRRTKPSSMARQANNKSNKLLFMKANLWISWRRERWLKWNGLNEWQAARPLNSIDSINWYAAAVGYRFSARAPIIQPSFISIILVFSSLNNKRGMEEEMEMSLMGQEDITNNLKPLMKSMSERAANHSTPFPFHSSIKIKLTFYFDFVNSWKQSWMKWRN